MTTRNLKKGFTLMELLIALVIAAILAAIAVPTYLHYTRKAYMAELWNYADMLKTAVASCITTNDGLTGCSGGSNGIPADVTNVGNISAAGVADGVITVAPVAANGIETTDTIVLTPAAGADGTVTWAVSGGACTSALISNCTEGGGEE